MAMVRKSFVVATTFPVDRYGGFQATRELLEQLAAAINSGRLPMNRHHDPTQPVWAQNVIAHIETLPDYDQVVVECDVESEDWARFEKDAADAGAPGGFSFTVQTWFGERTGGGELGISVSADAEHFSEADLLEASETFPEEVGVRLGHLYQFSLFTGPRVIVQLLLHYEEAKAVILGVAANYTYAYLQALFARPRQFTSDTPAVVDLEASHERSNTPFLRRRLEASSQASLEEGLASLTESVEDGVPHMRFEESKGLWLPYEP